MPTPRRRTAFVMLTSLVFLISLAQPGRLRGTEPARAEPTQRPNIVFIFGDDTGIDCFNCYGSDRFEGKSPHIDALAASGIRFQRAYSTPLCGPTRCLLMTGRYGFRTGGMSNQTAQNAKFHSEPSLARILKRAGYATGMAGKWRQMSDSPGDWGFDEYITDPTAAGWYWTKTYTKNDKTITHPAEIYYPDLTTDFAIDFIKRHRDEPFYFYLPQHLIHGPIVRTPDSKPSAQPHEWYDDNLVHLDKVVGRVVAALEELGLREKTLILFSGDNGTSPVGYAPAHDPAKTSGRIGGRFMSGRKGQLLEGGSRVPLIASWKGTTAPGQVRNDLIDFSDLLPTFTELAGAKLPKGITFDGHSFAPQLRGEKANPREWIYVQLGRGWYVRDDGWKLNERGELFSMKDAPFVEEPVPANTTDTTAKAARTRLQAILKQLDPGGGKIEPENPAATKKQARREARALKRQAKGQSGVFDLQSSLDPVVGQRFDSGATRAFPPAPGSP